jgi:hypothetical protein
MFFLPAPRERTLRRSFGAGARPYSAAVMVNAG